MGIDVLYFIAVAKHWSGRWLSVITRVLDSWNSRNEGCIRFYGRLNDWNCRRSPRSTVCPSRSRATSISRWTFSEKWTLGLCIIHNITWIMHSRNAKKSNAIFLLYWLWCAYSPCQISSIQWDDIPGLRLQSRPREVRRRADEWWVHVGVFSKLVSDPAFSRFSLFT